MHSCRGFHYNGLRCDASFQKHLLNFEVDVVPFRIGIVPIYGADVQCHIKGIVIPGLLLKTSFDLFHGRFDRCEIDASLWICIERLEDVFGQRFVPLNILIGRGIQHYAFFQDVIQRYANGFLVFLRDEEEANVRSFGGFKRTESTSVFAAEKARVRVETDLTPAKEQYVGALCYLGQLVVRNRDKVIANDLHDRRVEIFREKVFPGERTNLGQSVNVAAGDFFIVLHDTEFAGQLLVDNRIDGRDVAFLFRRQVFHLHHLVTDDYLVTLRLEVEQGQGSVIDDGMPVVGYEQFPSGGDRLVLRDYGEALILRTALLFLFRVFHPYFYIVHEIVSDDGPLPEIVVEMLLEDVFRQIPVRSEADAGSVLVTVTLTGVAGDREIETAGVGKRGLSGP